MVALGYALQAAYGYNTAAVGLACTPTSPNSMQVVVGPGGLITQTVVEATAYGSMPADVADPLVKMGINTTASQFTLSAPTGSGQSQAFLIEASFEEGDDQPAVLSYYNSLNPAQPYTGQNGNGAPQNTRRSQRVNLQLKAGTPANTGSQITPPVDTGYVGLWVITVAYGQSAIGATSIAQYPNAPFLQPFLSSHHGGVAGQAPKINLATEVQGVLPLANLPSGLAGNVTFAGNPNGNIAGNAVSGNLPPTQCWDSVNDKWWTCIVSGSAATAQWALTASNSRNSQSYLTAGSYSWTPPVGVTQARVTVVGGGGGGGGSLTTNASQYSVGSGGAAGSHTIGYFAVTPGNAISVTVGSGGAGGTSAVGNAGATSSFGSLASAPGGSGGLNAAGATTSNFFAGQGSSGNPGVGGNVVSGSGTPGQCGIILASAGIASGQGGSSIFGGGGINTNNGNGGGATAPGAGGGGGASGTSAGPFTGGRGADGAVIIEW